MLRLGLGLGLSRRGSIGRDGSLSFCARGGQRLHRSPHHPSRTNAFYKCCRVLWVNCVFKLFGGEENDYSRLLRTWLTPLQNLAQHDFQHGLCGVFSHL